MFSVSTSDLWQCQSFFKVSNSWWLMNSNVKYNDENSRVPDTAVFYVTVPLVTILAETFEWLRVFDLLSLTTYSCMAAVVCFAVLVIWLVHTNWQAVGSKSAAAADEPTSLAQWIWSVALHLRLHAGSWPSGCSVAMAPHDAPPHEAVALYLHGERQLALAAFLALVMSRYGHRLVVDSNLLWLLMWTWWLKLQCRVTN